MAKTECPNARRQNSIQWRLIWGGGGGGGRVLRTESVFIALLGPRISRWLLDLKKNCGPLTKTVAPQREIWKAFLAQTPVIRN